MSFEVPLFYKCASCQTYIEDLYISSRSKHVTCLCNDCKKLFPLYDIEKTNDQITNFEKLKSEENCPTCDGKNYNIWDRHCINCGLPELWHSNPPDADKRPLGTFIRVSDGSAQADKSSSNFWGRFNIFKKAKRD